MDYLNPEEVRQFLGVVPPRWYALFLTAITTGLRVGELIAMRWAHLDWNQGQYYVKEILARKRGSTARGFAPPKTEGSARAVDLTPACPDALREHGKRQAEEKLKAGERYNDAGLIFAGGQGNPLDDRNLVNRVFEPPLREAGLRRIRFHDLRHTCASLLIARGESPEYIQRQLRHASIQIAFDRYGHLFPDANRQAMARMDPFLFGADIQGIPRTDSIWNHPADRRKKGQDGRQQATGRKSVCD
jgi:integrase